jgi:hypothetical protein
MKSHIKTCIDQKLLCYIDWILIKDYLKLISSSKLPEISLLAGKYKKNELD